MKRKIIVGSILLLIFLNLSFFVIGYLSYLDPKLGQFQIESVVETNKFLTLNVTPSLNATKYEVKIKKDDQIIYEKEESSNEILLENLEAEHNDELAIQVLAFNKNNEIKESENTYNYVYKDASFVKDQNHLVSKDQDLVLNIDGFDSSEQYSIQVFYGKKVLYRGSVLESQAVIPYDAIKDYSGRLTAELYNKSGRKISTFTFYLNTPIVGKMSLLEPVSPFSTRWNDVTISFSGGTNANHFYLELWTDSQKVQELEVFPEKNQIILPANLLNENTLYQVVLKAVYEDYFEIAEQLCFELNVGKKETTHPVYVSHNPTFIQKGTEIRLKSQTEDATIYYTLDGSDPTSSSMVYTNPLVIYQDVVLKTYAVSSNRYDSDINTYSFQIKDKTPVIYLSPSNQYDNYGVEGSGYTTEKDMMNKLADVVERYLKNAGFLVYRNNPNGDINAWNAFSNAVGADFHLAIHSNGSTNHTARGIEIHIDDATSASLSIATNIYENLWQIYPGNANPSYSRGVKYSYGSLGEVNEDYVRNGALIEVAFHDNMEDALWMVQNLEQIGQNIANSIISYYN